MGDRGGFLYSLCPSFCAKLQREGQSCAEVRDRPAASPPRCSGAPLRLRPASVATRCDRAPLRPRPATSLLAAHALRWGRASCISAPLHLCPAAAPPRCRWDPLPPRPALAAPRFGRNPLRPRPAASGVLAVRAPPSPGAEMRVVNLRLYPPELLWRTIFGERPPPENR